MFGETSEDVDEGDPGKDQLRWQQINEIESRTEFVGNEEVHLASQILVLDDRAAEYLVIERRPIAFDEVHVLKEGRVVIDEA
jgi:hypothetical protein